MVFLIWNALERNIGSDDDCDTPKQVWSEFYNDIKTKNQEIATLFIVVENF